jgi:F0F1-type ATP synthase membrane subunit b/b'
MVFASEEGHGASLSGLLWRVLVFAVFVTLMWKILKDRIRDGLSSNGLRVQKEIDDAEVACKAAVQELADYTGKIADMGKELDNMKAAARNAAEKEAETMIADAEKAVVKYKEMARRTIAAEAEKAKTDIRKEVMLSAIAEAEKQIFANTDNETRQKFMSDNISKIGE